MKKIDSEFFLYIMRGEVPLDTLIQYWFNVLLFEYDESELFYFDTRVRVVTKNCTKLQGENVRFELWKKICDAVTNVCD